MGVPLPPGFQLESRGNFDPLGPLLSAGIEATNGYRTKGDIQRLKAEGYTPASNSDHLRGDAVDLVPGKSGLSLAQLLDKARVQFGPEAQVGIHNGTHVHVSLKGWGQAPGTPGTPYSGLPDVPPGFELEQRGALNGVAKAQPQSVDYSGMTAGADAPDIAPVTPGSDYKNVAAPDRSALVMSYVKNRAPYGEMLDAVRKAYPKADVSELTPGWYNKALVYSHKHPDVNLVSANDAVPLGKAEKSNNDFVQSAPGALIGNFANAVTAGAPVALAGDEGNYWEALSSQQHPGEALAGNLAGNVAGAVLGGKLVGSVARGLAEAPGATGTIARWLVEHPGATQTGTDLGMGAGYGAAENPNDRLGGAVFGAASTAALEGVGRGVVAPGLRAAQTTLADILERRAARGLAVPEGAPEALGDLATNVSPDQQQTPSYAAMAADMPEVRSRDVIDVTRRPPVAPGTVEQRAAAAEVKPEDILPKKGQLEEFNRDGNERFLTYAGADGKVANIHVIIGDDGRAEISVDPFSRDPNRFGAAEIRKASIQLKRLYPEIKSVWGERESGANPGRVQDVALPEVPALSEVAKAGNINLKNIQTPEDIDALMRFTSDTFGDFKGERRGVQSWQATEALAKDLGMTPDDLLSRHSGEAFNAEQAHAARGILAASAAETRNLADKAITGTEADKAAFVKSFLLHAAITEKASGAATEAGRALNIYRKVAKAGIGDRQSIQEAVRRMEGGATPEQVAAMVKQLADDPTALNKFARDAINPRFRDKLMFVWINALLSGPKTHVVNMSSNLLTAMMGVPEHALAAGLGSLRKGSDKVLLSEIGPRFYGMVRGGAESLASAREAFAVGDAAGKVDNVRPAITGTAGKIISIPTRALNAEDAFFKGMARRSEIAGLAVRRAHSEGLKGEELANRIESLIAHPTGDMIAAATDAALYKTFQRPLGPAGQAISNAIQRLGWPKLFVPFIRTPTNLLKYAAEHSPAAPLLTEVRRDFMAGGAKRDLAVARMVMGTGIGASIAALASQGHITGGGPADPSAKRALEANGWQPYSIKVGDTYVSYRRLDPWATILGTAADSVELQSAMTKKQRQDVGALLIGSAVKNLASKTWLSGLSDLIDAITDPQANAKNVITRLGTSMVTPTLSSQVVQAIDPVYRDTNGAGYMDTLRKRIEARVPGLSTKVIAKRDIFGDEIRDPDNALARLVSPFDTSTNKHDPDAQAILESGARFSVPSRTLKGARLPDEMYDVYQSYAGQLTRQYLDAERQAPGWPNMSRDQKAKVIERAKNRARKDARTALFTQ